MSTIAVHEIFDQIRRLSPEDRQRLDGLLTQLEEEEWQQEATKARRVAQDRGIDQPAIDRAVARTRYGS